MTDVKTGHDELAGLKTSADFGCQHEGDSTNKEERDE
jgi:hypothetical protein